MTCQTFHDAAAGTALLLALLAAPLAADAVCQWAGAADPALEQAQTTIGGDTP